MPLAALKLVSADKVRLAVESMSKSVPAPPVNVITVVVSPQNRTLVLPAMRNLTQESTAGMFRIAKVSAEEVLSRMESAILGMRPILQLEAVVQRPPAGAPIHRT